MVGCGSEDVRYQMAGALPPSEAVETGSLLPQCLELVCRVALDQVSQPPRVIGRKVVARPARHLAMDRMSTGQHPEALLQRFHDREPKALFPGREDQGTGMPVSPAQFAIVGIREP